MKVIREYMCDFLDYKIKDMIRMKNFIEEEALEEEPELEKAEEQPISYFHTIIASQ